MIDDYVHDGRYDLVHAENSLIVWKFLQHVAYLDLFAPPSVFYDITVLLFVQLLWKRSLVNACDASIKIIITEIMT